MKKKDEWIDFGDGLGRIKNPRLARTSQQVKESTAAISGAVKATLDNVQEATNPHRQYWYALGTIRQYLTDAEEKLKNDFFHLGVLVPEKFSFGAMEPKPKKKKKKKRD